MRSSVVETNFQWEKIPTDRLFGQRTNEQALASQYRKFAMSCKFDMKLNVINNTILVKHCIVQIF